MADSASFISDLNENSPYDRDPRMEGAGQIRTVKTAIKNCFPNVGGEVVASHDDMNIVFQQKMQIGMIMMYSGNLSDLSGGWAPCDGVMHTGVITPDLRGKFIMGSTESTDTGEEGGSHEETDFGKYLKAVDHKLNISQIPEHSHEIKQFNERIEKGDNYHRWRATNTGNGNAYQTGSAGSGEAHHHGIEHKLKPGSDKERVVYDKRPAWYALAYIMFVGF